MRMRGEKDLQLFSQQMAENTKIFFFPDQIKADNSEESMKELTFKSCIIQDIASFVCKI